MFQSVALPAGREFERVLFTGGCAKTADGCRDLCESVVRAQVGRRQSDEGVLVRRERGAAVTLGAGLDGRLWRLAQQMFVCFPAAD